MCSTGALKFFLVVLVAFCGLGPPSISAKLYPTKVNLIEGEGFVAILEQEPKGSVQNCQLTRKNKLYFFEPGSDKTLSTQTGETLTPLNLTDCGVRIFNMTSSSGGEWKLTSIDTNGSLISGNIQVQMKTHKAGCPTSSEQYCSLINTDNLSQASCSQTTWKNYMCEYLVGGRMTVNTHVVNYAKDSAFAGTQEVLPSGSTIFKCSFEDLATLSGSMVITGCLIVHEDSGAVFNIEDGLQDTRYSAYKTDFKNHFCEFEIPNSIQEHEIGVWKMHMVAKNSESFEEYSSGYYSNRKYYSSYSFAKKRSCSFYLWADEEKATEQLVQRTQSKIVIKTIADSVNIQCAKNVFYPLTRCYLLLQNNTIHFYDDNALDDHNCEFITGPGNWTCGFNGPTKDDVDFIQKFEVIQYDREIIDETMKGGANGTITLECHHVDQNALKVCLFLSPTGKIFSLPSDSFESDKFSYHGGHLATGDCGIELSKEAIEPGKWQCIFRTLDGQTYSTDILVDN